MLEQLLARLTLGTASEKKKKKKNGGKGHAVTFAVSGFHFFQGTYSQVMKQSSFSTNFCIVELLSLNYVIRFYKPKKGLFLSRF